MSYFFKLVFLKQTYDFLCMCVFIIWVKFFFYLHWFNQLVQIMKIYVSDLIQKREISRYKIISFARVLYHLLIFYINYRFLGSTLYKYKYNTLFYLGFFVWRSNWSLYIMNSTAYKWTYKLCVFILFFLSLSLIFFFSFVHF